VHLVGFLFIIVIADLKQSLAWIIKSTKVDYGSECVKINCILPVYLHTAHDSHNKQWLFSSATSNDWFLHWTWSVFSEEQTVFLYVIYMKTSLQWLKLAIRTNSMSHIMYIKSHTNYHSYVFRQPLTSFSGSSVLKRAVFSQHIRMVTSYKQLWND
jgi:hypothetical protein